jgi:peroxiredoxin
MKGKPVDVFIVNYGEFPARIAPFVAKESITLPVLLDTQLEIAKEWKVGGLPMTFVIDAKGRARYWTFGERDWGDRESVQLIDKVLAEGSVAGR